MQTLVVHKQKQTGWIRFHRPDVRNAVNLAMIGELESVIREWKNDRNLKAIVFLGDERAFVSGGDVSEFHQWTKKEEIFPVMRRMGALLEEIARLELVTVAAVEGFAVGGGCEIVVSCDFCLASPKAKFGMIQVNLGITTGWGGAGRLMRKIGRTRALDCLLTGRILSGEEAKEWGIVDALLPEDGFRSHVESYVEKLTKAPVSVIRAYKQVADKIEREREQGTYELEAEHCAVCWESDEHRLAVESFLNRTRAKKE
ncbi:MULTISPECIES: enoyl-CoA hydratase/isomerase family protein [Thermoactinomyces]|uniref:Ethylmalonyl-CoA decarboxylase n=1 Tax=Thermoactinomyces daqus TaxID=1329516 RepID=A0A7W1X9K9_9BACL|nr:MULTISPECIES: enoyl-CoA hydratase/isomerase family protein [Thermoactinomyces]MBA4542561.1 enoyl-CoA hydratase/isomerase family protein [Thermoactinomyces daqus]MBH8598039.1 enoyl-CoA hydratase/isomerase family protein [Thermoactinomyces sp. CICC 10523]MBH8603070.1 enoyl-CoA hydratase/isomerase family protein [Thermoactinomyces sp. CICC 10522]MBH8607123.1 enoyl-CoA hydratase/isomerase family protein [Thermoactinomyces sp. CICC 10521]